MARTKQTARKSTSTSKDTAGYQMYDLERHSREKGMWAGALKRTTISDLYGLELTEKGELRLVKIPRDHTPAILKIIDEGLVNASDHKKECEINNARVNRVTRISLTFDRKTGNVVIENDGPGIPILVHKGATEALDRTVYVPELAFAIFLTGRNMKKPLDCIKGGINGIGGKLMNIHSSLFGIETVSNGQIYCQIFRDRMRERGEPHIFKAKSTEIDLPTLRRQPHTRVSFQPAYDELGYETAKKSKFLADQDGKDLEAWCRWRMHLIAAYVGPKVAVTFNESRCCTTNATTLATLCVAHDPDAIIMSCTAKATTAPHSKHPWDIAVAVVPTSKRFKQVSVINGVNCSRGSHITYLKKIFNEAIGKKLQRATKSKTKKTSVSDTCKQIFLVIVGALPGADWGGQRKDELQVSESLLRPYKISTTVLNKIAGTIADNILRSSEKGVRGKKRRIEADKYTRARKAGTKDAPSTHLLLGEGDSAMALIRAGLKLGKKNPNGPTFELYGMFSLGGVPMNAMRKVTKVKTNNGSVLVRSDALRNNVTLKTLVEILGLDYTNQYSTAEDIRRLRYGGIIICTDQDLDGTGKILPLTLAWVHLFWPNLIKAGYVKRFVTPVIRAYPKTKKHTVCEFFYENEFENWVQTSGGTAAVERNFRIKYFKGLATHDGNEVQSMFERFNESVHTFTLDDDTAKLFETYFGPKAEPRKIALSTPVSFLTPEESREIQKSRRISCNTQLQVDAKAYKLDDIQRKIPGITDGFPIARRKILAGALRRFSSNNKEMKVFQLCGYIALEMMYHHGDASLNGTITKMAQYFTGGQHYPYLSGIGIFGTRHLAGNDAGSPRYINVRLAGPFSKAMHPAPDLWTVPYVFEDGERAQPQYFVPVLPAALLESINIPSEGWKHTSFARDFTQVVALTRAYISGDKTAHQIAAAYLKASKGTSIGQLGLPDELVDGFRRQYPLEASLKGYDGDRAEIVRIHKGYLHTFGWYSTTHPKKGGSVITVTELPIQKSTQSFLNDLKKTTRAKFIEKVDDFSSETKVNVRIQLIPEAYETIKEKYGSSEVDPIEHFLLLRSSLKPLLNFFDCVTKGGGVLSFGDDYHSVFFHWVSIRRDLYRVRFEREITILQLKIRMEREIVTFIESGIDLATFPNLEAASAALAKENYSVYNSALLRAPRYTSHENLESLTIGNVSDGKSLTYNYLFGLKQGDLVKAAKNKRINAIEQMEERISELELIQVEDPFAGASVWQDEVDNVVAAVALGERTQWKFK